VRTASSPLPISHLRAFEAKFAVPVIETYGLTEAASTVAANPLPPGMHKAGSVGLPLGVGLRVCVPRQPDEATAPPLCDVAPGDVGEICIQGPSVVHAYQGNADPDAFQDGWFRTGDLGYQDRDGYLFITGRRRDVINRGGENIAPREVEEVLALHPDVREVAVIGRPDALYGEVVVAYVVLRHPDDGADVASLRAHASQHLSRAKVPVDYIPVDALPRTASGKLARQQLRQSEVHS
jgi:acyl-CoA synthetase (AMP-forming)/AMP-acid ligase II